MFEENWVSWPLIRAGVGQESWALCSVAKGEERWGREWWIERDGKELRLQPKPIPGSES